MGEGPRGGGGGRAQRARPQAGAAGLRPSLAGPGLRPGPRQTPPPPPGPFAHALAKRERAGSGALQDPCSRGIFVG